MGATRRRRQHGLKVKSLVINYDIIGDVHGHAEELVQLLSIFGYHEKENGFVHPNGNQALFVGDLINRGPDSIRVLEIVKKMHTNMQAQVVLGNHEFRLIQKSISDQKSILPEMRKFLPWIKKLPLFLELPSLRIVHAAWHFSSIEKAKNKEVDDNNFIRSTLERSSEEKDAVNTILQGIKTYLPNEFDYHDRFGIKRNKARIRWWESDQKQISGKNFFPASKKYFKSFFTYSSKIKKEHYNLYQKPVFFGHYCLPPEEGKIFGNKICLDGCVTCDKVLWGYRFKPKNGISTKYLVNTKGLGTN